ncbi:MAG: glutaredoxin family protein [Caldilineaceae bacterium]|nr:glutaredoxin family protein [Caldilineaceae bacterium]
MQLILYTKPGCHLCDLLKADLTGLQREIPFTVVERNIEADPADYERFRYLIPVLAVGDTLFYPPHDLMHVRRALLDAAGRPTVG